MKQTTLSFHPQPVKDPIDLPVKFLLSCDNWRDAVRVGISKSYVIFTQNELAECLGYSTSHFNEILNRKNKYFDFDRLDEMQTFLGNNCVSQYFQLEKDRLLHKFNRPQRELSLEEENALLREQLKRQTA
jgi:hypothetical protein